MEKCRFYVELPFENLCKFVKVGLRDRARHAQMAATKRAEKACASLA
jgi:hypothetical protein